MTKETEMHHKYMVRRIKLKPKLIGLDGTASSSNVCKERGQSNLLLIVNISNYQRNNY